MNRLFNKNIINPATGGGGGGGNWGAIAGDLTEQTDLNDALAAKEPAISTKNTAFNKNYDAATINLNGSDALQVKDGGITTNKIADGQVTFAKIADTLSILSGSAPAGESALGEQGDQRENDFEFFVCVSANQWIRIQKDRRYSATVTDATAPGELAEIGTAADGQRIYIESAKLLITALSGSVTANPKIKIGNNATFDNLLTATNGEINLSGAEAGDVIELTTEAKAVLADATTPRQAALHLDTAPTGTSVNFEFVLILKIKVL